MSNVLDLEEALFNRSFEGRLREALLADMPSDLADRVKQRFGLTERHSGASAAKEPGSAEAPGSDGTLLRFHVPGLDGVEFRCVVGLRDLHQRVHDGYSVVLLSGPESMRMSWTCNGKVMRARSGDLQVFVPGDVEVLKEASAPFNALSIVWQPKALKAAATQRERGWPLRFPSPRIRDAQLEKLIPRLFVNLGRGNLRTISQSYALALDWFFSLSRAGGEEHSGQCPACPAPPGAPSASRSSAQLGAATRKRAGRVRRFRTLLDRSLCGEPEVAALALRVERSESWLQQRFHEETGVSVPVYLRLWQLRAACRKLQRGEAVEVVAAASGFRSKSELQHSFLRHEGVRAEPWQEMVPTRRGEGGLPASSDVQKRIVKLERPRLYRVAVGARKAS